MDRPKVTKDEAIKMIRELLEQYPMELSEWELNAFTDMAAQYTDQGWLSVAQAGRVKEVHDRIVPKYENLVSSGQVPRGKEVPTPEILKNLPLKPPKRKVADDGS